MIPGIFVIELGVMAKFAPEFLKIIIKIASSKFEEEQGYSFEKKVIHI